MTCKTRERFAKVTSSKCLKAWWCAQSDTNRSPCYLANIRVIFEKNSERITKSLRRARRRWVFRFLGEFENREKQGASIGVNREMSLPIQPRKARNSFACRMSAIEVGFGVRSSRKWFLRSAPERKSGLNEPVRGLTRPCS
jgi:hypothetical protein